LMLDEPTLIASTEAGAADTSSPYPDLPQDRKRATHALLVDVCSARTRPGWHRFCVKSDRS
jgi:hypothetical protein